MKESVALAIMEAMGEKVIVHDDKMLLRAQKTRVQVSIRVQDGKRQTREGEGWRVSQAGKI